MRRNLKQLASTCSRQVGKAQQLDANLMAQSLRSGDVAFVDPPYSGVHYSRFYHVLESIALGGCGDVSGKGRYPAERERPRSKYSVTSEAKEALDDLLGTLAMRGAKVIMTFPNHGCSNGLSGSSVKRIAARHFAVVRTKTVASRFSTLGGTSDENRADEAGRSARRNARELVLTLSTE